MTKILRIISYVDVDFFADVIDVTDVSDDDGDDDGDDDDDDVDNCQSMHLMNDRQPGPQWT